jgi:hypothetical protein
MARVTIPINKLPVPGPEGKHKIRFRVTTKDYNEISEWSPVFLLESTGQVASSSAAYSYNVITPTSGNKNINITWEDVHYNLDNSLHDIFVQWSTLENFEYLGRYVGNSVNVRIPSSASSGTFKVQLPSYPLPPEEEDVFKILETEEIIF